jgi:hypothetical protein
MRRSEDGGDGGYVDGLVSLETGCGVSGLERLDRRQIIDEAEKRRILGRRREREKERKPARFQISTPDLRQLNNNNGRERLPDRDNRT